MNCILRNTMELQLLNKQQLDDFVSTQPHAQFLQSWNWGEFQFRSVGQKSVGHKIWRFGAFDEHNKLIATTQIIGHNLKLKKSYLYSPRGPIVEQNLAEDKKAQIIKLFLSKARDLTIQTSKTEEIFFRLEPTYNLQPIHYKLKPTKSIQPSTTLILDLTPSTANLLANMHQKTRYNIHLAERKKICIRQGTLADFENVWPIFEQTSTRDEFSLHPKKYYQIMLKTLKEVELWLAYNNDKIITANLVSFFGDTVTYLHGASNYEFRQLMAPYLLQWTIIQEAKNRGYNYYDFHGIAPTDDSNHPWAGITKFKKGFNGEVVNYPGTFDFIYENNWYRIYKLLRKFNYLMGKI